MIEVRMLGETDILEHAEELTHLLHICLEENFDGEIPEEIYTNYYKDMKVFIRDGSAIIIGAFNEDKIVGFYWAYVRKTPAGARMHGYHVAIEDAYRGQNIINRFMKLLEIESKKRGIYTIEAMCTYANKTVLSYLFLTGFKTERLQVVKHLKKENDGNN